jgi:hypothetical protein
MSTEQAADPPQPPAVTPQPSQPSQGDRVPDDGSPDDCACRECDGSCVPAPDDGDLIDRDGSDDEPPSGGIDPAGGNLDAGRDDEPEPSRPAELVIPLLTLLGLAERPGEGHGLGPLDPALCRDLALFPRQTARAANGA